MSFQRGLVIWNSCLSFYCILMKVETTIFDNPKSNKMRKKKQIVAKSSYQNVVTKKLTDEEIKFAALSEDERQTYLRWQKHFTGNIDDWRLAMKKVPKKIFVEKPYLIASHPQGVQILTKGK